MPTAKKRSAEGDAEPSRKGKRAASSIAKVDEVVEPTPLSPTKQTRNTRARVQVETAGKSAVVAEVQKSQLSPKKKGQGKAKVTAEVTVTEEGKGVVETAGAIESVKRKSKRKTKEEKEAEAMPLAARTKGLAMFIGAHVSSAGGVHNSVTNALHIGGNSFALFLKSQRKWANPALHDEHRDQFHDHCNKHVYAPHKHVLPHGSYLVNLAQADSEKADQAYESFIDDLKRCEALGIRLYNFHPGNAGPNPRPEAISRIAKALNRAHEETQNVIPVLENMAGAGNVIGSTFEDIRDIIDEVEDKSRVGVCIDTCHTFAAGYDLRTPDAFQDTMEKFDEVVGMRYLRALHVNDSKAPLGSHRDLHQNIGLGFLGLRAFHNVMNEKRFEDLPLVLETPVDRKDANGKVVEDKSVWATEIKLLESLIGMDPEGAQFQTLEKDLAAKGAEERDKLQEQVDRKTEKDKKAPKKQKSKGRKKTSPASETESNQSE